ncbi:MAG TPA: phage holin family protein [Vicinamibacterales bacterium]|nr:phage holin family protein [Vicinamibacterales bacterium]
MRVIARAASAVAVLVFSEEWCVVGFLLRLVVNAAALWVATEVVPGVSYTGGIAPFVAVALIFGVINATLRPITKLLTCPLILLTLGLFALIVNGLMLWLTSTVATSLGLGFRVAGFWPAFWGALVVSIISTLLSMSVRVGDDQGRRR